MSVITSNKEFVLLFDRVGKDYTTIPRGTVVNNLRPTGDGQFYFTVKATNLHSIEPVWCSILIENTETNLQVLDLLEKIKNQVDVQERNLYPLLSTAGSISLGKLNDCDSAAVLNQLSLTYALLKESYGVS